MTLCVAWLREVDDKRELVFATDSCLSGGERWHAGIKLIELPRKDLSDLFFGRNQSHLPIDIKLDYLD